MTASEHWAEMVREEHAQSDRIRGGHPSEDHWVPYAQQFVADPRRSDPLVDALRQHIGPHDVLMDVGAGAGRMALPLALTCRRVVAVEPSPSMGTALMEQATSHGIKNVALVQSTWQEAQVEPVDVIICCHVIYTVQDIDTFIQKLASHARKVVLVLYEAPPQSGTYGIWEQVHGEPRKWLPSLPELKPVLEELGIKATLEPLEVRRNRGYATLEDAVEQLSVRLFLQPGSKKVEKLRQVLPDMLEEVDGELRIRGSRPLTPYLVVWEHQAGR